MKRKTIIKIITALILLSTLMYTMPVMAYTKDETVYSKINTNSELYSTLVTSKISNNSRDDLIDDISNLLNIENLSGDEEYSRNGNTITWKTNGNNITYKGSSNQDLPIKLNIKYELDGQEVEPQEIVGRKGKVKVILDYENLDAHTKLVNGKYIKMYTPFVVVAGSIINNENNTNIEISNGKVIDNGNSSIVIGIAMPGGQESLGSRLIEIAMHIKIECMRDSNDVEMNRADLSDNHKQIFHNVLTSEILEKYLKL